jgi:hypothetical protein
MTTPQNQAPKVSRLPSPDSVQAALRHVYNATSMILAALMVIGLSQGDATAIGAAVHAIGDGVAAVLAGVSVLVPFYAGAKAWIAASRASRLKSLNADPQIEQVITKPGSEAEEIARTIPGDKVT